MPSDKQFLTEQILAQHSKAQTMRVVEWVGHDAGRLETLMDIFLGQPHPHPLTIMGGEQYRLTQRSAWAVRYVGEKAPELMTPWLPKIVARLREPGIHDAVKRNALNVFEPLEIPDNLQDDLADLCFGYLAEPKEALAIRCASMTVLEKICRKIPELKPELRLLIEEHFEHGTAGFKSRARKVLEKLD
jgi:hypothetical protein